MMLIAGYVLAAVAIVKCETAPAIDGSLDDACWRTAAKLDGFVQTKPGDNTPASRATEILLAQDADALYIGVRAGDDPSRVRATVARRDDVLNDDHVALYLDTFDDRRRAYVLILNPLGIQQDGLYAEGRDVDYSVDLVLQSKGGVTQDGYVIEAALPFSSLRYRAGTWGVHAQRRIRHLDEEDSWRPLVRGHASLLDQAGTITGLGELDSGRMLEVIPGVAWSERARTDPNVTMKFAPTPNIAFDATVNPDFAQIESDELVSTANQRFPIFFAEKRPFFLEGIDVFQSPLNAVHTRTIIDPDYATKVSGKSGRNTFAVLLASDRSEHAGVLRVRRDVGTESQLGFLATSREDNHLGGVDGRISLNSRTVVSFQLLGTSSNDSRGLGFFAEWKRSGRHLNVIVSGEGRTPGYRANLGFTTQTDTNRWSLVTRYDSEPLPDAPLLLSWSFTNTLLSQWDWDGRVKYAYVYPRITFNFRRQTQATLFLYSDYVRIFEEEFAPAKFLGEPERSTIYKGVTVDVQSKPAKQFALALNVSYAVDTFDYDLASAPMNPGTGDNFTAIARVELQPVDAFRIAFDHTRNRLVRDDSGRIAFDEKLYSTQATYQFTRFAFARVRADYDAAKWRGQFVLGWTPVPGTSLYGGYSDDGFSRTVFLKASYLWRLRT
ncbi:MAG TPA: DUF5916 domain-containing protein [Thermoanaerobaculia bacterium]|nr:DUF5916 domain-containing protein [Thermoanaerobaculia bacterium]